MKDYKLTAMNKNEDCHADEEFRWFTVRFENMTEVLKHVPVMLASGWEIIEIKEVL